MGAVIIHESEPGTFTKANSDLSKRVLDKLKRSGVTVEENKDGTILITRIKED